MLRNYFKIAWRNMSRRGFYSAINISGLAIGIVFTLLIASYIWKERGMNNDLRNASRQYILTSKFKDPNFGFEIGTLAPLAKSLKEEYPGVVAGYYRMDMITSVVSKGDKHLRENIQAGDTSLLRMYDLPVLYGDRTTALDRPNTVVLQKSKAIKYFGRDDVVGETISIQNFSGSKADFEVTAVLDDMPENSVTNLVNTDNGIFTSIQMFPFFGRSDVNDWRNIYVVGYVELQKNATPAQLNDAIRSVVDRNVDPLIKEQLTVTPVALNGYYLQKDNGLVKKMTLALGIAGLFILLMAIVNFINISISGSSARIREIGVRKVLGGKRKQLIAQFLAESTLLAAIAMSLALIMYSIFQPLFEKVVGKDIPGLSSFPLYFIAIPFVAIVMVGLLAGIYPAIVLSSLKSVDSLKGKLQTVNDKIWLRRSLVGLQFVVASVVLIAAFIVQKQVAYFFGNNLGYNKESVVSAQLPRDWSPQGVRKMETLRDEFAKVSGVENVSLSFEIPDGASSGKKALYKQGDDSTHIASIELMNIDENFTDTYGLSLKAGQFISAKGSYDSSKIALNETAIKALGWKEPGEAIGQHVLIYGDPTVYEIAGVTADFHFGSLAQVITPLMYMHPRRYNIYRYLSFKLKPGNVSQTLHAITEKWSALLPSTSFEYKFMDQTLERIYKNELQLKKATYTASLLCLCIALLGIISMVTLDIRKRVKEIGIRKVVGASVASITSLFIKEFLWIVLVAGIIACPVAWMIMNNWLNGYAYRIDLGLLPFITAVVLMILITSILVIVLTIRAGMANPVKSLRTE